ncbi:MAG: ABC transporter permease [Hydrogenophilaceae bacterium]|nr:ABC transporter permease [Hydrogenophilaceae bacterium]
MKAWLNHHAHSLRIALERFRHAPFATLFTVLVIGIAITLPAGLYLLLDNVKQAAVGVEPRAEVNVFLRIEVPETEARQLAEEIRRWPEVAATRFVSRDEALQRLEKLGLGEITAGLPSNPLPHAVAVTSRDTEPTALDTLAAKLRKQRAVDAVSLDGDWARRLNALLGLGSQAVWLLAGLFGLALAAITGNTIRLQIYAQRDEIEVARLIGATDRFIRRPFLYFGGLQGLLGGLAAWGLTSLMLFLLQDSTSRLAAAYGSHFALSGLDLIDAAILLAASGLLGLIGAWIAVSHTQRALNIP